MNQRPMVSDFTPAELSVLVNGCGSKSGPFAFLRPPQGHATDPCNQHDLDYITGGSRWDADWNLLHAMLGQASGFRWWQRPGFRFEAIAYWLGVRLGGSSSFHHGPARTLDQVKALARAKRALAA